MRAALLIVGLLAVSGCAGPTDEGDGPGAAAECPDPRGLWSPLGAEAGPLKVDGVLRSDLLGFFPKADNLRFTQVDLPDNWKYELQAIGPEAENGSFVRIGVTPTSVLGTPGTGRDPSRLAPPKPITANWTTTPVDGCPEKTGTNQWRYLPAGSNKNVQPGDGVAVYYAGFWLNGTLFSTNMGAVDASAWPRGGWYQAGDNKPLNVYVYDRDRSEMTAQWSPRNPTDNKTVAWSYSPTIPGFNAALKGLSTGSPRVVVIPPEQAYTSAKHILYGVSLVFYIDVVEIVDVPCPPEVTNRNACRLPA